MTRPRFLHACSINVLGCALALALVAAEPAGASSVLRLNDQQLVGLSTLIIEGRVVEMHSEWNPNRTQIHTLVTLDVARAYKGTIAGGKLTVRMLGGRVGDIAQRLVDAPTFSLDEDVIVFFEKDPSQPIAITGFNQGKLTVRTEAGGRRVIAERGIPRDEFVDSLTRLIATEGGR